MDEQERVPDELTALGLAWQRVEIDLVVHAEPIAKAFHQAYEENAPTFGYETREASAKPWAEVPANNRALMIATVAVLLEQGVITFGPNWRPGK
jgi:hypothetical protein